MGRGLTHGDVRKVIADLTGSGPAQREPKRYEDATPGSRPPRGPGGRQVWIAGDFRRGEFRKRRDALRHCPAGVSPLLVTVDRREVEA